MKKDIINFVPNHAPHRIITKNEVKILIQKQEKNLNQAHQKASNLLEQKENHYVKFPFVSFADRLLKINISKLAQKVAREN